jgi:hypothetical protein
VTGPTMPARRARLGRYALWHLRDYLRDKGIATLITLSLIGFLNHIAIVRARSFGARVDMVDRLADQVFVSTLDLLGFLGVLFATNGIVADDRRHGYYRLLFARPVSIVTYYAHKFVTYGVGFLIVSAVLLSLYNAGVERFFNPTLLPTLALVYVALGGIGFLLSAAWRFDWLSLATVYYGSQVVWRLFGEDPGWQGAVVNALPPVHLLDGIYGAVRAGESLPADDLTRLVVYGVVCLMLGLVVVRRRPLAG